MKPGDKVLINCPSFSDDVEHSGVIHSKNFTEGLISVHLNAPLQGVYDFDISYLTLTD